MATPRATLAPLIRIVASPTAPTVAVETALSHLFEVLHHRQPGHDLVSHQDAAVALGAVDALVRVVHESESVASVTLGLVLLRFLSFQNHQVEMQLAAHPLLREVVETSMHSGHPTAHFATSLVQTMAANFHTHDPLLNLAPLAVSMLASPSCPAPCKCAALKFLGNLCYNDATHSRLRCIGVEDQLIAVLKARRRELFPLSAAIALACLSHGRHPFLELGDFDPGVLRECLQALQAALWHRDYPPGTGGYPTHWKLMLGVRYLARGAKNREVLLQNGLVGLVRLAAGKRLVEAAAQPRAGERNNGRLLHTQALLALWELSTPGSR